MTIAEAAKASGLSVDTIRFYEKSGMLPRLARDARGWRRFPPDAVEWLRNLERLRATGMPMTEMRRFAVLVHASPTPDGATERLAILQTHAKRLEQRQAELDACKAYLARKVTIYSQPQGDIT